MQPLARCHTEHVHAWLAPRALPVVLKQKFIHFPSKQRAVCAKSRIFNPDIE